MKARERLLRALEHREPDRIPIDLGSPVTSIHVDAYIRLKNYLQINGKKPRIIDMMQQIVEIDEEVLQRFKVDTRHIFLKPAKKWQQLPDGKYIDEWGIVYKKPKDSHYYDMVQHPLAQATIQDLDRYSWPDPEDPSRVEGLKEKAKDLYEHSDYAIVLNGFGECLFGLPSWLRGHAQFYMDLVADKDFANALLDRILDYEIRLAKNALREVGKYIHVVRVSDDLGTEKGPIISPSLYREMIKPRQKKLYQFIKEHSDAKILLHSCGSVYELIPDFIEIGVDALNPVQVAAKDMDSKKLKSEFGDKITFWGGGCDTQRILPFGTLQEVEEEVKRRIKDFAPGGGFVFAPVHNIQFDVSAEKICLLYDTALKFGTYPINL
ncbi:uroporphyrinogen-III decarboxylase [Candidatus Aerophobetes bacterium]|nr:uroporphyrinogen-III decarboxylase [Candidatus Aerophobetes bacterium]